MWLLSVDHRDAVFVAYHDARPVAKAVVGGCSQGCASDGVTLHEGTPAGFLDYLWTHLSWDRFLAIRLCILVVFLMSAS